MNGHRHLGDTKNVSNGINKEIFIDFITRAFKMCLMVGIIYLFGKLRWSILWFIGPIFFMFLHEQWKKGIKKKFRIKKAISALGEKKVLNCLEELPAWAYFSEVEKVEWVNTMIVQVWPNIHVIIEDYLRDVIQPLMQQKLKEIASMDFKFDRIIISSVPIRVSGIKVFDQHNSENGIIMDMDVHYAGNSENRCIVGNTKAGIKALQLKGTVRVIIKPLINTFPLIGGLQLFFLNNPDIDFDFIGVANVFNLPFLKDLILRTVSNVVAQTVVLPNKIAVKLSDQIISEDILFCEPEGVLRVNVIEAKNLMRKDRNLLGKGKSDPYAIISVGAIEYQTPILYKNLDPKWNFLCEFPILESEGTQLKIRLWDKDEASYDENLGRATINVSHIIHKGEDDMWISLEQAKHGMVHLKFSWMKLSNNVKDLHLALHETKALKGPTISAAVLSVFIDSAKNLPQLKTSSKPDPFAQIQVGDDLKETYFIISTCDPVWDQTFHFLIKNLDSDSLVLKVIDKKTGQSLGLLPRLSITNNFLKKNMEICRQSFSLLESGQESQIILTLKLKVLQSSEES